MFNSLNILTEQYVRNKNILPFFYVLVNSVVTSMAIIPLQGLYTIVIFMVSL